MHENHWLGTGSSRMSQLFQQAKEGGQCAVGSNLGPYTSRGGGIALIYGTVTLQSRPVLPKKH
jgi:hypothetical protein